MKSTRKNKGFTIVEVIIVVTMLGLIMPAIFSILFVILQQQMKIYEITETKRQGDYIMQIMKEKVMRDGRALRSDGDGIFASSGVIASICTTSGSNFTSSNAGLDFVFLDENGEQFQYVLQGNSIFIRINGSPVVNTTLNNARVTISNFQISCNMKSNLTAPIVSFSYLATFNRQVENQQLGTTQLQYQTKVKLRNFILN